MKRRDFLTVLAGAIAGVVIQVSTLYGPVDLAPSMTWRTYSPGMVRRVFPRMIATDLISVQPMATTQGSRRFLFDAETT